MRSGVARLFGAAVVALALGGILGPASAAAEKDDDRFTVVDLFLALQADEVETVEAVDVAAGFKSPVVQFFLSLDD